MKLVLPNDLEDAREALEPLGLKLVPGQRRLTYVVVEKARWMDKLFNHSDVGEL
jgi:hypothetical protein